MSRKNTSLQNEVMTPLYLYVLIASYLSLWHLRFLLGLHQKMEGLLDLYFNSCVCVLDLGCFIYEGWYSGGLMSVLFGFEDINDAYRRVAFLFCDPLLLIVYSFCTQTFSAKFFFE